MGQEYLKLLDQDHTRQKLDAVRKNWDPRKLDEESQATMELLIRKAPLIGADEYKRLKLLANKLGTSQRSVRALVNDLKVLKYLETRGVHGVGGQNPDFIEGVSRRGPSEIEGLYDVAKKD